MSLILTINMGETFFTNCYPRGFNVEMIHRYDYHNSSCNSGATLLGSVLKILVLGIPRTNDKHFGAYPWK